LLVKEGQQPNPRHISREEIIMNISDLAYIQSVDGATVEGGWGWWKKPNKATASASGSAVAFGKGTYTDSVAFTDTYTDDDTSASSATAGSYSKSW
jgi:hypothetical protein